MSTTQLSSAQSNKGLNIGLWIAQVLLAGMFLMAGVMKTITPIDQMVATSPWVKDYAWLIRFIGISELAGGLGLLLPSILRIKPVLTPIAAIGILIIMILAAGYHAMHAELSGVITCVVLGLIATFIAWGRLKKAPISGR